MAKRKMIEIDRDLCDGCGLCTTACAEAALALDEENKAVLVRDIYCDGMGACLDVCPTGALKVVEREGEDYNSAAAYEHVLKTRGKEAAVHVHGIAQDTGTDDLAMVDLKRSAFSGSCPGSTACEIPEAGQGRGGREERTISGTSELRQWPIQLHLVSPFAPYFKNAELLIAADCTAFAMGSFHQELLRGKKLIIACPKLDETGEYAEKLAELIRQNNLKSLTVAIITVPCCTALWRIAERAVEYSGTSLDLQKRLIHINGTLVE